MVNGIWSCVTIITDGISHLSRNCSRVRVSTRDSFSLNNWSHRWGVNVIDGLRDNFTLVVSQMSLLSENRCSESVWTGLVNR